MSAEGDETEAGEALSVSEEIAKAAAEEQAKLGDGGEEEQTDAETPAAKEPKQAPEKFQAAGRRGARERRKLEKATAASQEAAAAATLAAQERAELEEARELRKLREADPAAYARRVRLDLDKLTDGLLLEGTPQAEIQKIKADLAADKAEREKREEAAGLAAARDEERKFKAELDAAADEYPAIADLDPEELFGERGQGAAYKVGREIEAELKRLGHTRGPTNAEIFAELNAREQEKIDKRAARLGYTKGPAPAAARGPAPASGGRTITRGATSQRAAAPPPADDFNRVMSSAERVEAMVQLAKRQAAGLHSQQQVTRHSPRAIQAQAFTWRDGLSKTRRVRSMDDPPVTLHRRSVHAPHACINRLAQRRSQDRLRQAGGGHRLRLPSLPRPRAEERQVRRREPRSDRALRRRAGRQHQIHVRAEQPDAEQLPQVRDHPLLPVRHREHHRRVDHGREGRSLHDGQRPRERDRRALHHDRHPVGGGSLPLRFRHHRPRQRRRPHHDLRAERYAHARGPQRRDPLRRRRHVRDQPHGRRRPGERRLREPRGRRHDQGNARRERRLERRDRGLRDQRLHRARGQLLADRDQPDMHAGPGSVDPPGRSGPA